MTDTAHRTTEPLRAMLEEHHRTHTGQLTTLTSYLHQPDHGGHDPDTLRGLIETARQGVADAEAALRRMDEGTYGVCKGCEGQIPEARLEILPWARYCVPCQQKQSH